MSLFLHLNPNLAVELKEYSPELYFKVIDNLKHIQLIYTQQKFRIINNNQLKGEHIPLGNQHHHSWNFPNDSTFVLTNEVGLKVIFDPDLHLEYISRKRTRQGFNLFLESIIKNPESRIRFKIFSEELNQKSGILNFLFKTEVSSYEEFISHLSESKIPFKEFDLQVINEFSEFFYLKSEKDFELLKFLYIGHKAKFNILLKHPEKKITILKDNEQFEFDALENHEIFLSILDQNPKISKSDIFDINLRDENVYSKLHGNVTVRVIDSINNENLRFTKCACAAKIINGKCSNDKCPFTKSSKASVILKKN